MRTNNTIRPLVSLIHATTLTVIAAATAYAALGCGHNPKSAPVPRAVAALPRAAPGTLVVVADRSSSNLDGLGAQLAPVADISGLLAEETLEKVLRVDRDLRCVYEDVVLRGEEELLEAIAPGLAEPAQADNTYLNLAFVKAADAADAAPGAVIVIVCTDWAEEGMSEADHRALREAVRRLAANPKVAHVVVLGADPAFSQRMDAELAPLVKKLRKPTLENADLGFVAEELSR